MELLLVFENIIGYSYNIQKKKIMCWPLYMCVYIHIYYTIKSNLELMSCKLKRSRGEQDRAQLEYGETNWAREDGAGTGGTSIWALLSCCITVHSIIVANQWYYFSSLNSLLSQLICMIHYTYIYIYNHAYIYIYIQNSFSIQRTYSELNKKYVLHATAN